ncbi:MAG TPA: transcriptional regulator, partial [Thermoanaerobaculia bacterium]|nr:transcriptional regulator [Thermoanaerobaculia bacterium]
MRHDVETTSDAGPFRLANWAVDPAAGELRRDADGEGRGGEVVRLEPKVMAVLVELARRPGRVVGKEELLAAVWPDVTVTEDAVWRSIATLRRVLDDDSRAPRFIETLPRRGYRLLETPVAIELFQVPADSPSKVPGEVPADFPEVPATWRRVAFGGSALAALLVLALVLAATAGDGRSPVPAADQVSAEAARYLESARQYQLRGGEADLERAAGLYRRAIDAAPRSATAHAGLAATWGRHYAHFEADRAMLGAALAAAERAVGLDPRSADAQR